MTKPATKPRYLCPACKADPPDISVTAEVTALLCQPFDGSAVHAEVDARDGDISYDCTSPASCNDCEHRADLGDFDTFPPTITRWRCPECGSDDLTVSVSVTARLTQDPYGRDATSVIDADASQEWDNDSPMYCSACKHCGIASAFMAQIHMRT